MATDEEFQLFRQELQKLQQDMALTINTLKDRAAGEAEKIYEKAPQRYGGSKNQGGGNQG